MHNFKKTASASAALVRLEMLAKILGMPLTDPRLRTLLVNLQEMYALTLEIEKPEAINRIEAMLVALQAQRDKALKQGGNEIREYVELAARYTNGLITPHEINAHLNRVDKANK